MRSYAEDLDQEERWAVVAYVRALQLSGAGAPRRAAPGAPGTSGGGAPVSLPEVEVPVVRDGKAVIKASLGAALVGVILLGIGVLSAPAQVAFSYLAVYAYLVSIALGALIFLMICHAMRATWPVALRRLTEAIVKTLPVLLLLFVPLLFGLRTLYPWLHAEAEPDSHLRHLMEHRAPYLKPLGIPRPGSALFRDLDRHRPPALPPLGGQGQRPREDR